MGGRVVVVVLVVVVVDIVVETVVSIGAGVVGAGVGEGCGESTGAAVTSGRVAGWLDNVVEVVDVLLEADKHPLKITKVKINTSSLKNFPIR